MEDKSLEPPPSDAVIRPPPGLEAPLPAVPAAGPAEAASAPPQEPELEAPVEDLPELPPARDAEDPKIAELPSYLEPAFSIKDVIRILHDPKATEAQKMREILGARVRFWYAPAPEMHRLFFLGLFNAS